MRHVTRAPGHNVYLTAQNLAAETAAYLTTSHPDYAVLAARIAISNLHKETKKRFSEVIEELYNFGVPVPCCFTIPLTQSVHQSIPRMASQPE